MTSISVRCPQCGMSSEYRSDNPSRPFCNPRCKLIDLGAWAEDRYAIAGPTALSEESGLEASEARHRELHAFELPKAVIDRGTGR